MIRKFRKKVYKLNRSPFGSKYLLEPVFYLNRIIFEAGIIKPWKDVKIENVFCYNQKIWYIANPKVATRSFVNFFVKNSNEFDCKIVEVNPFWVDKTFDGADIFSFSFVRNPVDRIISCYRDKILNPDKIRKSRVVDRYKNLYGSSGIRVPTCDAKRTRPPSG